MERVTVREAAQELNMDSDCLRFMMKKGTLPIGVVKEGKNRTTYYIYRESLDGYKKKLKGEA